MEDSELELRARLAKAEAEVSLLSIRLAAARKMAHRCRDLLERRRVPVLVETEANGAVTIYAEHGTVEIERVDWPRGEWTGAARDTVEEWLGWMLNERHRDVYLPGCVELRIHPEMLRRRTLVESYGDYEKMLVDLPLVRKLVEMSREQRKDLKEVLSLEGKANAQTKKTHRRTGAAQRGA